MDGAADKLALAAVQREWPRAELTRDDAVAARIAQRAFVPAARGDERAPLRAVMRGTEFQVRVWQALLRVEAGQVTSYGVLAASIGEPSASRAVGTAVGRNPIAYLIPCHRVIRQTGVVGEYRWGAVRKRALLAWEGATHASAVSPPFAPPRRIIGFHQDEEAHWVADLDCGHGRHVRHDPPWQERPWVVTATGRARYIGTSLECQRCADGEPRPALAAAARSHATTRTISSPTSRPGPCRR